MDLTYRAKPLNYDYNSSRNPFIFQISRDAEMEGGGGLDPLDQTYRAKPLNYNSKSSHNIFISDIPGR